MPKKSKSKKITWDLSKIPPFIIWNRLKSLRQNSGLTQVQLAVQAGVSPTTITGLEAGMDTLTMDETKKSWPIFSAAK